MVRRSIVSDRALRISFWRLDARADTVALGSVYPTSVKMTIAKTNSGPDNPRREARAKPPTSPPIPRMIFKATIRSAVSPGGFPANTIRRWIRRGRSMGVARARPCASLPAKGRASRSSAERFSCSSRILSASGMAPTWLWSMVTARRDLRFRTMSTARTSMKMVRNVPMSASTSQIWLSNIDFHDPCHHEDPQPHERATRDEQDPPDRGAEEQADVVRVHHQQVQEEQERKGAQDGDGEPPLGRQHLHLAHDVGALPDRGGHDVQDLRQVAAHLPLDVDRHDRPPQVLALDAVRHGHHGIVDAATQPDLRYDPLELGGRGVADLLRHLVQGLEEAVAGPHRARQDRQHVAQLLAHGLLALAPGPQQPAVRDQRGERRKEQHEDDVGQQDRAEDAAEDRAYGREGDELSCPHGEPCLFELVVQADAEPRARRQPLAGLHQAGRHPLRLGIGLLGGPPAPAPQDQPGDALLASTLLPDRQEHDPDEERPGEDGAQDDEERRVRAEQGLDLVDHAVRPPGAKTSAGTATPRSARRSMNRGRSPVAFNWPRNLPSSSMPEL